MTNSLNFLPNSDEIVLIDNGSIVDSGSYEKLVNKNGPFSDFIKTYLESKGSNDLDDEEEQISESKNEKYLKQHKIKIDTKLDISETEQLIQKEKIESGNVRFISQTKLIP